MKMILAGYPSCASPADGLVMNRECERRLPSGAAALQSVDEDRDGDVPDFEIVLGACVSVRSPGYARVISYTGLHVSPIHLGVVRLSKLLRALLGPYDAQIGGAYTSGFRARTFRHWVVGALTDCVAHPASAGVGTRVSMRVSNDRTEMTIEAPCAAVLAYRAPILALLVQQTVHHDWSVTLSPAAKGMALSVTIRKNDVAPAIDGEVA